MLRTPLAIHHSPHSPKSGIPTWSCALHPRLVIRCLTAQSTTAHTLISQEFQLGEKSGLRTPPLRLVPKWFAPLRLVPLWLVPLLRPHNATHKAIVRTPNRSATNEQTERLIVVFIEFIKGVRSERDTRKFILGLTL